jgi:branched-chain amino acid transport system substrate-binding protein
MTMPHVRLVAVAALALALGIGACGGDDEGDTGAGGDGGPKKLTIYSSLPLQGAARAQAVATVNGAKLALKEAGGKVGDFAIQYESLDDSTAQAGGWEPGQTASNARKAIADDSTIAYIGEFNSGATAVSLPLLNEAGIAQVSPGNTAVGITSDDPGAAPGEPDKYYPTGNRTYARILPKDTYQGAALAALANEEGCASAYILNDKEVYGAGLARNVELSAEKVGLEIKGNFKDMAVALPEGALLGPEGVGETGFFDPDEGGLPPEVARRVLITIPGVAPEEYPPAGQQFLKAYEAEYGEKNPDRYAVYGYESMSLVLDAIKRAGADGDDRAAVVEQLLATKDREGVFGKYSIDENGDITLTPYGVYSIEDGALAFDRSVEPQL